MSRKTLNEANLEKLGAPKLAALVMELVQGSAVLQRRARMELSAAQGPKEVAADIRKRFAALRRATSYVGWQKQRALVKDLNGHVTMIATVVAPDDPDEAFELLWSFLQLAPALHGRTDDSNGALGDVMAGAIEAVATLAPRLTCDPKALAERILDAVADAGYGEFDGIIPATAEVLGKTGLDHLKRITTQWAQLPPGEPELERYARAGLGLRSSPEDIARRHRQGTASVILADVADAQGDVDAYMARYSAEQLTFGTIAPDVARRLLEAGRLDEALAITNGARAADDGRGFRMFRHDLDLVYEECLEQLGQTETLKSHLWDGFQQTLSPRFLRKYLKLLPDFDDIEAEEQALDHALSHPHTGAALGFLTSWPALGHAARLVLARIDEIDGNAYDTLSPAAEALSDAHPLAATLLRRAMIDDTLDGAKSKRYRHAARHLTECKASAAEIADFGDIATHDQFTDRIRQKHGRKHGFWQLLGD